MTSMVLVLSSAKSQEIQARLTVMTNKISTAIDKKIFMTLQTALTNFLNQRKWSTDVFAPNEKIQCNFLLSVEQELGNNVYKGRLTVQAARPVYNTTYDSPIINFIDDDVVFRYQEFQPIEDGTEFYKDNLSAVFSFYAHFILGLDAESFALGAGDEHFQLAQNILNQIPPHVGDQDKGWTSLNKKTTRYWMVENMLSARYKTFKEAWYNYHRKSLDVMHSNLEQALTTMVDALRMVDKTHAAYPNTVGVIMFVSAKSDEIVEIFKTADRAKKTAVYEIMRKLDPSGAGKYNAIRN